MNKEFCQAASPKTKSFVKQQAQSPTLRTQKKVIKVNITSVPSNMIVWLDLVTDGTL